MHVRFRRAVRVCGHFPNEQAALKCSYLTVRSLDPTGRGRARCITRSNPPSTRLRRHFRRTTRTHQSAKEATGLTVEGLALAAGAIALVIPARRRAGRTVTLEVASAADG
jgi:hypothetical protein